MTIISEKLAHLIERIENLQEKKQEITEMINMVKREAKASGFDVRTINEIIRLRKMTDDEREEYEALLDIYKGALGMLHDTPLGEAARRRLSKPKHPKFEDGSDAAPEPDPEHPDPMEGVSLNDAKNMGTEAQKNGKPVTDNPFPARDPRRAAWDEAWCASAGSDGMDIPEAWKRKAPKKSKKPEDDAADAENESKNNDEGAGE